VNIDERHLSELDIKYISSTLGRIPTEIEISFIEFILMKELKSREYLQILKRLDDGAKREVNNKIELDDKYNLFVNTGFKIIDQNNKVLIDKDETRYINKINNFDTILGDIIINSSANQNVEKILSKEVNHRKGKNAISGRFIKEKGNEIIFSTSIGLKEKIITDEKLQLNNSLVYKIDFGKRYFQKNITQLNNIIDAINNEDWFIMARSINWNGLGVALINLIKETNNGIRLTKDITIDSLNAYFLDDNTLSILFVVQHDSLPQLNVFCRKYKLNLDEVGTIINEQIIHINNDSDTLINLPVSVFDLQYNINTKHFIKPEIDIKTSSNVLKKYKNTSYTNQLLKLLTTITANDVLWDNSLRNSKLKINNSSYGLYSINDSIDGQIVLTQADKNHLIDISPRLSGRVSVASAVRRLSCTGAKPKAVIVKNIFPKINKNYLWKASELLQGQEEAIRELEVEIGNRSLEIYKDYWHQNISAIGIHKQNSVKMDIDFKNDGDFISLLGSHRGELTGSAYEQYITNEKSDVLPTVDLKMEKRLQDVVLQGISTNLIKSAVNVSTGGISIAIAKSLLASESGLGARIHLSRKLKEEELLFGETQGLVIVSLSEVDIMEFERICMTIGVPSTTIGRVTDNDLFTFNEAIKIKVDKLRGCY
jgi:hypothetical protein